VCQNGESSWTLGARWVFPIDGQPLEHGTLTLRGGRILAVEPCGSRTPDTDIGNAALVPGFANAHTHLDLSGLRNKTPPRADFTDWLRAVIQHRRSQTREQIQKDIEHGLAESLASGTTLLGDIAAQGLSWPALCGAPLRSVVFYELLGLPRARAHQAWAAACAWVRQHRPTSACRPGLSTHAPYSVRTSLFRAAASLAQQYHLPLATHLAESFAELRLLTQQQGPFVTFLKDLGVWDSEGLVDKPETVIDLHAKASAALFVHANYLHPSTTIPQGATVVYCPRTHAAFGHKPHPFCEFLAAGVRVALGTDSLASNPDLSVLNEARYLHEEFPDLSGEAILRMATLSGAEALGWQDETGSLAVGKSADFTVLKLPNTDAGNPHDLIFSAAAAVDQVYIRGEKVYQADATAAAARLRTPSRRQP